MTRPGTQGGIAADARREPGRALLHTPNPANGG